MPKWSFFDQESGMFSSKRFAGPRESLAANTPKGQSAIEGTFDPLSQRVEVGNEGQPRVVDYQPPSPGDDYDWRENVVDGHPRWVKKAAVLEREMRDRTARSAIEEIEKKAGPRAVRDALLALLPDGQEKQRLDQFESEIAEHRKDLFN